MVLLFLADIFVGSLLEKSGEASILHQVKAMGLSNFQLRKIERIGVVQIEKSLPQNIIDLVQSASIHTISEDEYTLISDSELADQYYDARTTLVLTLL